MNRNWPNTAGSDERTGCLTTGGLGTFSEQTSAPERSSAPSYDYPSDRTLSVSEDKKLLRQEKFPGTGTKTLAIGKMNRGLLARAEEILDGFDIDNPVTSRVDRESLCGIVLQLWEGASKCSEFHQDILAILENGLLSTEKLQTKHLSLFREAIRDLQNDVLTQAHVEVIHHRFIAEGVSPLALLTEVDEGGDSEE